MNGTPAPAMAIAGRMSADFGLGRGQQPMIDVTWDDAQTLCRMAVQDDRQALSAALGSRIRICGACGDHDGLSVGRRHRHEQCQLQRLRQPMGQQTNGAGWFIRPERFGLYDMVGNVWEWVQDCYHDNYNGAPTDGSAWTGGDCSRRVVRGGSWGNFPVILRSANRDWGTAGDRSNYLGFRVARTFLTP